MAFECPWLLYIWVIPIIKSEYHFQASTSNRTPRYQVQVSSPNIKSEYQVPVSSPSIKSRYQIQKSSPSIESEYHLQLSSPSFRSEDAIPVLSWMHSSICCMLYTILYTIHTYIHTYILTYIPTTIHTRLCLINDLTPKWSLVQKGVRLAPRLYAVYYIYCVRSGLEGEGEKSQETVNLRNYTCIRYESTP